MTPSNPPTITDRLREQGHTSNGEVCQKCWDEAFMRSIAEPSKSQSDHYFDVMADAEDDA